MKKKKIKLLVCVFTTTCPYSDFRVAPIRRCMPLNCTTTCSLAKLVTNKLAGKRIEPTSHSVRSEATNH